MAFDKLRSISAVTTEFDVCIISCDYLQLISFVVLAMCRSWL